MGANSEYGGLARTVKMGELEFRIYDDEGIWREQKRKKDLQKELEPKDYTQ